MMRHAAAIAIALCVNPSPASAQDVVFTVATAPARVYKAPTTASPVIGNAPRAAVLEVTRELGSWVKVVWPAAEDGVGYVHVSMGSLRHGSAAASNTATISIPPRPPVRSESRAPSAPLPRPAAPAAMAARAEHAEGGEPNAVTQALYVKPPTHIVGVGGRTRGPSLNVGATARAWPGKHLGVQFDMSRESVRDAATRQVTSTQFTPSVLYSLPGRLTDYFWVRPYIGAGSSLQHRTLNGATTDAGAALSENRPGFQAFGGGEVTFAGAPRFALSADLGYQWLPTSFAGVTLGGLGLSVSGHWYIK